MRKPVLPKCGVRSCLNEADPRWFARDVNDQLVMICDGHDPVPTPFEVIATDIQDALVDRWDMARREDVVIARCRHCGFETFPFADATIEKHMEACRSRSASTRRDGTL